jgi:hypothetical protein
MEHPHTLDRRIFLEAATGLLLGTVVAGSPLAAIARGRAWAVGLSALTTSEGATLIAVARTICPHDNLDDAAYALVAKSIDEDSSKDEKIKQLIQNGIARLGASFSTASEQNRVEALKRMETSPFFQTVRGKTLEVLYSSPIAYAYFGYEGEAFSKGGYLLRGFNDLHWLPEVPLADSGPLPVAP